MRGPARLAVLEEVASRIPILDRPVLVAVDGVDGSGKTTFADELAEVSVATSRFGAVVHDVDSDTALDLPPAVVPAGGLLLLDGVFTQRDELRDHWDLAVFLDVPFEVSVSRMARATAPRTIPRTRTRPGATGASACLRRSRPCGCQRRANARITSRCSPCGRERHAA